MDIKLTIDGVEQDVTESIVDNSTIVLIGNKYYHIRPKPLSESVDKGYEILSFRHIVNGRFTELIDGRYGIGEFTLEDMLYGPNSVNDGSYEIYSIQSDYVKPPIKLGDFRSGWGHYEKFYINENNQLYAIAKEPNVVHIPLSEMTVDEEEVERDWEILSFKRNTNEDFWHLLPNGKYGEEFGSHWELTNLLNDKIVSVKAGDIHIYSVKRLKDNCIWTIGDSIDDGRIEKFKISEGVEMLIWLSTGCYTTLSITTKPKPVLYQTSDGVNINDRKCKLHIVLSDYQLMIGYVGFEKSDVQVGMFLYSPLSNTYFFNEDNAKEFILLKKKVEVSKEELLDYIHQYPKLFSEEIIEQFFKEKINL